MNQQTTDTIRNLNDRFRQGDPSVPGQMMITIGVKELASEQAGGSLEPVLEAVRSFSAFSPDNDPHLEHDFGAFDLWNEKLFWKIDHYAPDLQSGSADPADITQTVRVLTIMLAREY